MPRGRMLTIEYAPKLKIKLNIPILKGVALGYKNLQIGYTNEFKNPKEKAKIRSPLI
jgi:hypothetical protein